MIANSGSVRFTGRAAKQLQGRRITEAVGGLRQTVPLKAGRFAAIVGHSETQESRIRSGQRLSPTGHAALAIYEAVTAEACPLEAAGYCSAFIEVTLRAIAMWPELEALTTEELHAELRKEIALVETRANGVCNDIDAAYLADGSLDIQAALEAHTKQATSSTRITAILQILGR